MKPKRIEIRILRIHQQIDGISSRSMATILEDSFRQGSAGGIPLPEDLDILEMYEIMKLPVIRLKQQEKQQPEIKILCCCCFRGSISVYLLSGDGQQISIVNLSS
jgi:hypothetical protein